MPRTLSSIALTLCLALAACDKGSPLHRKADAEPEEHEITVTPPGGDPVVGTPRPKPGEPDADLEAAPPTNAATAPAAPAAPVAPVATGTVVGTIKFAGAAPVMPPIDRSRDSNCPQDQARQGWVVVGAGGTLSDAVVHFAPGAVKGAPMQLRQGGNVVDQKGCLYRPYVVGLVKGQKLRVKNSDPTAHNVRAMNGDDQLFNEMHIAQAPDKMLPVDAAPGASVQLKCDIHPWMETWVYVSDNSLFAVTGADGKFSIEGVPAGSYEIEVWHPHLGKKTAKITIKAGETTTATIPAFGPADYKAPQ
jgi:plastocyanin